MNLFLLLKIKEDIFEEYGKPNSRWDPLTSRVYYTLVSHILQIYLLLFSAEERNPYKFETTTCEQMMTEF